MSRQVDPALVESLGTLLSIRHVGREESSTWEGLRGELEHFGFAVGAVRRLQEAAVILRARGVPVVGLSGSGVFLARSVDEVDAALGEKRRRALAALGEMRTLKRLRLAMLGQAAMRGLSNA